MTEPNIEALATELAYNKVWDWVTGDNWEGYPSSDAEEEEARQAMMPSCRLEAMRIVNVLYPGYYPEERFYD